jgi:putative transposase
MSRSIRNCEGGLVYHAFNRANGGLTLFEADADYEIFVRTLREATPRYAMRVLAFCVMPNHFHLVLWPHGDGDLSQFMRWLTMTHTQRWHAQRRTAGAGHLYQGRFKSFPVQDDCHLITVCRYVERNAVHAGLVDRAELWRWGSLSRFKAKPDPLDPPLSAWPIKRPTEWIKRVNAPLSPAEDDAMQRSLRRGQPFGDDDWRTKTADRLGLSATLRPIGRPRKRGVGS